MGSWGIKALQSDEGLDIIELFNSYAKQHRDLKLKELIAYYKAEGFLATDKSDIGYLYDTTAIALGEIYLEYLETGQFATNSEPMAIHSFTAGKKDVRFLMECIDDIINEKPDGDGEGSMRTCIGKQRAGRLISGISLKDLAVNI
jgi:hypothetical protein